MDVTKRPTDSTASTKSEQTDATSRQTSNTSGQKSTTCRQNIKSTTLNIYIFILTLGYVKLMKKLFRSKKKQATGSI